MSQAYASLWKATSGLSQFLIGSCYFLSAALTAIGIGLAIVGAFLLRGRDLDNGSRKETEFRPTYRLTEKSYLTRWYAPPIMGPAAATAADERDSGVNTTEGEKELHLETIKDSESKESCDVVEKY
jgi:hypothetical protein